MSDNENMNIDQSNPYYSNKPDKQDINISVSENNIKFREILLILLLIGLGGWFIYDEYIKEKEDKVPVIEVIERRVDTFYSPGETIIKYVKGKDIYVEVDTQEILDKYSHLFKEVKWNGVDSDTVSMIIDYEVTRVYKDTFKISNISDSSYVSVTDTVRKNKLIGRTWESKIDILKIKDSVVVTKPSRKELYWGFNSTLDKVDVVSYLGAGIAYKTDKDRIYTLNLGIGSGSRFVISGGVYFKLNLKNNKILNEFE